MTWPRGAVLQAEAAHGLCFIHPTISGWVGRVLAPRPQSRQQMVDMVSLA